MRYVVMLFGVLGLIGGISAWVDSHQPHEFGVAIGLIGPSAIVLAMGLVAEDIVQAIKGTAQPPRGEKQRSS